MDTPSDREIAEALALALLPVIQDLLASDSQEVDADEHPTSSG